MSNLDSIQKLILGQAVMGVGPGAEMFKDVQVCSASKPAAKTNPFRPAAPAVARDAAIGTGRAAAGQSHGGVPKAAPGRSGMFNNVQERSAGDAFVKTNPPSGLTPRQVSAARWIVAGRSGRATARELGVEEHAVSRWRRLPAFQAEIERQQRLLLATLARGSIQRRV